LPQAGAHLHLPPGQRQAEIAFAALTKPDGIAFKYRMVGFDAGWVEAGTRRTANYSQIPVQLPDWAVSAEVRHSLFLAFKETPGPLPGPGCGPLLQAAARERHVTRLPASLPRPCLLVASVPAAGRLGSVRGLRQQVG